LAFSQNAEVLLVGGEDGLRSLLVSGSDLLNYACSQVSRNMSADEWRRDIGGKCELICTGLPGCK